jgi:L-aminopeptidase/D-esterase-like protein
VSGFPGLAVGHATDPLLKSGVTVFLPDTPAVAAVHVSGGAPATRETNVLAPGNTVERVDAIVLSGGSAYGLSAADGVMAWLAAKGRGFRVGDARVPIVPAAALFDLNNGGDKSAIARQPIYAALGEAACEAAGGRASEGSLGAGTGATTADIKGGFGAATTMLADGGTLAAFAAVNPVGRVTFGASPHFRAAPFEQDAEFGGLGLPSPLPSEATAVVTKQADVRSATTLAVIATDYALTRDEAKRLAIAAHDGIALAIFPAHTPFDGNTVFALTTSLRQPVDERRHLTLLCAAAASTLARAISRAIYTAEAAPGDRLPTWRDRYGAGAPREAP